MLDIRGGGVLILAASFLNCDEAKSSITKNKSQ